MSGKKIKWAIRLSHKNRPIYSFSTYATNIGIILTDNLVEATLEAKLIFKEQIK